MNMKTPQVGISATWNEIRQKNLIRRENESSFCRDVVQFVDTDVKPYVLGTLR